MWGQGSDMNKDGTCGNGAACEKVCPIKMMGRICPDVDDIAHMLNIAWGIIPAPPRAAPVAA